MNAELKYDKRHCKIYYHADINSVHLEWHGFASDKDFQDACEYSLNLLIEFKASKVIADNRNAKVVSKENQDYLGEVWFPKAYEKGYRSSAVIVAENVLNQMSVRNIIQNMEKGKFEVQHFKTLDEARDWLKTIKN